MRFLRWSVVVIVADAAMTITGCKPTATARAGALGDYADALQACRTHSLALDAGVDAGMADYETCAEQVDARFGVVRDAGSEASR